MSITLALAVSFLATLAQDKTYDLKLDQKPVKGQKSEKVESSVMKMTMKITGLPEPMNMTEETSFAAAEEVLSAEADGSHVALWKFSKATKVKEGQVVPLSFQGKTVKVTREKGKPRVYALEGGTLTDEDMAALKKAFMGGEDKPGEPTGAEMFAPKKPVKVGESWNPDVKTVAQGMFDEEMAGGVDFAKSSCTFTLKSVENRSGVDFGKIDGILSLSLAQFGPMKLDTPVVLKLVFNLDGCIDGRAPDGVMTAKAEMKGKSSAAGPNGKIDLDLDMTMTGQMTVKSVK